MIDLFANYQPMFGYLGTIATIATIVAAAAGTAATAYAAAAGTPKGPDAASSSREVAQAQAQALPSQRALAAQEQQGGSFTQFVPKHKENQPVIRYKIGTDTFMDQMVSGELDKNTLGGMFASGGGGSFWGLGDKDKYVNIPYKAEEWEKGGKYNKDGKYDQNWVASHLKDHRVTVPAHQQTSDFKGYGTADIEGRLAQQMADVQERLGAKYGEDFAREARREAELADPQGFAARARELELIQQGINNPPPIDPLATSLDERMQQRVKQGSGLDSMSTDLLNQAVAQANADRSGATSADDVARLMTTGDEGAMRRQLATQQVGQWLSSGATPEDVQYKREQQNLSNLGNFVAGQTPQSQFASLSGAGQGAAPFYTGQKAPQMPNNASTIGPQYGLAAWQQNLRNQSQQANPWLGGVTSLLSGINAAAGATGAGGR